MIRGGQRRTCHHWFPGVAEVGGIQRYGRAFLEAFLELRRGTRHEIFLKNDADRPGWIDEAAVVRTFGQHRPAVRALGFGVSATGRAVVARPGLVMAGHLHFAPLAARVTGITGGAFWVLTYGFEAWELERPRARKALQRADRVLAISRFTADRLVDVADIDPARIDLLPCTFDPDAFCPAPPDERLLQRYGLDPAQPVILTVSRLPGAHRRKGHELVLQALPAILREVPNARYLLVGDGPDRNRIEAEIERSGLGDAVILAGEVPDGELSAHYNLASVFAMPGSLEGFGIVFLEALSCGVPSIGGNRDGSRDALLDGEVGVLVDPDDADAFAHATVAVLRGTHPNRILRRPRDLRRRAIEAFGPHRFRERLSAILSEAEVGE